MPEITDDTKELILDNLNEEPSLELVYKKILNNRREDKSIQLWVCLIRTTKGLDSQGAEDDNPGDGGSWSKIYGFLFNDENEVKRATKAKTYFLIGWLEIIIFFQNWIENTITDKDYFQYMKTIHQKKKKFLPKDQFIFSEKLDYSINSLGKWQNYLICKEKIPKDIKSLKNISENQKNILKSIIIKNQKIKNLKSHINDKIDDSFSLKQQEILKKIIGEKPSPSLIEKYISELKPKLDDKEINVLDQMATFIKSNKNLIFPKKPRFLAKKLNPEGPQTLENKLFSKKPWKVFASKRLHSYYYNRSVGDIKEKKFPKCQESLKTINFQSSHGSKRPSIVNMISWIDYLTDIYYRDVQMKNSFFEQLEEQHSKAKADNKTISQNIKTILLKIEGSGYKGLPEEEKHIIDEGVKESPKIKWEFKVAKLNFTEKKIIEDYHKRKALRDAAKKEESLWDFFIIKLKDFTEQIKLPKAAIPLLAAGIAGIIISYGIYSSGPAKFNVDLSVTGRTITGSVMRGEISEYKEMNLEPNSVLKSGDFFKINIKIEQSTYYYLVLQDSHGIYTLLSQGQVNSDDILTFPDQSNWYELDNKKGIETIILIASDNIIENFESKMKKLKRMQLRDLFAEAVIKEFSFKHE